MIMNETYKSLIEFARILCISGMSSILFLGLFTSCSGHTVNGLKSTQLTSGIQTEFNFQKLKQGGVLFIPEGVYEYDATALGELQIKQPIKIFGAGKNKTILKFKVTNKQASIRILASNVEIKNLEIQVNMIEALGGGGKAEYGTGITAGWFFQNTEHEVVKNLQIEDVVIRRKAGSFVATAITLIGRVSEVNINNIDILGFTSKLVILHWGGYTVLNENILAPEALEHPDYGLFETYHPHDIQISNIFYEEAANLFAISSSYNVHIQNVSGGPTSDLLFMLPGDEINDFAVPEDKTKIGSNITLENIDFDLKTKIDFNASVIRITSFGASILKKDNQGVRLKQELPYKNLLIKNINVKSVTRTAGDGGTRNYRFGINAHDLTGENIVFKNINFLDVAKDKQTYDGEIADSYGIHLRNSEGINSQMIFDNIQTGAKRGVGITDSKNITVTNSIFNRFNPSLLGDHGSGIYFIEKNDVLAKVTGNIIIQNSVFGDFNEIVRYPPTSNAGFCLKVTFINIGLFLPFDGNLERDNNCL